MQDLQSKHVLAQSLGKRLGKSSLLLGRLSQNQNVQVKMNKKNTVVPVSAQWLSYAGIIPFIVLPGLALLAENELRQFGVFALRGYAACVASFLGAIYWGLVMKAAAPNTAALLWGVSPSLLAFAALLQEPVIGLIMVSGVLWLCYFIDSRSYPDFELGHWLRMRLILTTIASLACISAIFLT